MINPIQFLQEVRAEVAKVTWPSQNETFVTTIFVLLMVIAAAIFFFLADQAINTVIRAALSFFKA